MANKTYRFRERGLTLEGIVDGVGPEAASAAVDATVPYSYQEVTIDESLAEGLIEYAAMLGYDLIATDPPASAAVTVAQTTAVVLAADSSSIPVASGWTDVSTMSVSFATLGDSILRVLMSAAPAAITVGAEYRTLINGGSFSDQVLRTVPFKLTVGLQRQSIAAVTLPSGNNTYTVRMQARGVGLLSSVSLEALVSFLSVVEYKP